MKVEPSWIGSISALVSGFGVFGTPIVSAWLRDRARLAVLEGAYQNLRERNEDRFSDHEHRIDRLERVQDAKK